MNHTISKDRKTLTIHADAAERQELADIETCGGHIACDVSMHDFLEPITCNSELEWLPEGATGDLTSAPMLGILGDDQMRMQGVPPSGPYGIIETGFNGHADTFQPILERWAFMDYQVRSVLEDLRDRGEAVFVS